MPHIYYAEGPPTITMGAAGVFVKGVSRDIEPELAAQLLKKTSIVFQEGVRPEASEDSEKSDKSGSTKKAKEVTADGSK